MYVRFLLRAVYSSKQRMIKLDFFHVVNLKNVRCISHFCCVQNRVKVKAWSKLTLKTWTIYDVCHIFVECRIEYEIKNARIKVYYFHSKNLKNLQCMLHFCFVPGLWKNTASGKEACQDDRVQVTGAPNDNIFGRISVRKTIWELEFSKNLL